MIPHSAGGRPERLVHVHQGEFRVSNHSHDVLTAVLGSCVACCLYDPDIGVGGMNHFLLPTAGLQEGHASANIRYGTHSMEMLLNALFKLGALKRCLQAKLFGGGKLEPALGPIGSRNAAFAHRFLADEGIACIAESLGGTFARRLRFEPTTGKAQQLMIPDIPAGQDFPPVPRPASDPGSGSITLFEE